VVNWVAIAEPQLLGEGEDGVERGALLGERAVGDRSPGPLGRSLRRHAPMPALAAAPGQEIRDQVALDLMDERVPEQLDKVGAEAGQARPVGRLRVGGLEREPLGLEPIEEGGHVDGP
jgi:hypothetical protein